MATEELGTETPSTERSLRDELIAARDAVMEPEAKEEPSKEPTKEAAPEAREERPRAPDGKFARLEPAEPEPSPPPAAEPAPIAPPAWSLAAKSKWNALDPEVRAEIVKREADVHKGFTKMDEERSFGKTMQEVIRPYEAILRAEGIQPAQAIQSVLNTTYILRTADPQTKARAIAQVCRQYGVDMNLLAQPSSVDPNTAALQQRLAQLEGQLTQQQQRDQQALADQVTNAVESFSRDPKHPHFEAVRTVMGALMQSGDAKDMEEAYQMAVYARPDIRSALQASEDAKRKEAEAVRRKAEQARLKGSSVRGGPGGVQPPAPKSNGSVREDIEAAFAEHSGRI